MKKGVKKNFVYFTIVLSVLMISGVFAETLGLDSGVQEIVEEISKNKGINEEDIENIKEVGIDKLPSQVDVENIDDTNLAFYEVSQNKGDSFFVITVSDEKLKEYTKEAQTYSRTFLNFGSELEIDSSQFLETSLGVGTSLDKGYVMVREGSITALSTNLEALQGSGEIEFVIYKNGEAVGFRNNFIIDSIDVFKDYDSQSFGIVNFEAGDVLTVYSKVTGDLTFQDVITLVEITTE